MFRSLDLCICYVPTLRARPRACVRARASSVINLLFSRSHLIQISREQRFFATPVQRERVVKKTASQPWVKAEKKVHNQKDDSSHVVCDRASMIHKPVYLLLDRACIGLIYKEIANLCLKVSLRANGRIDWSACDTWTL